MEAGATATDLLGRFLRVQRQRAEHYAGFTAMFRTYLSGRNEVVFREGVQQTTAAFGSCSQQVRELEAGLREGLGRDDLAAVLRSIQVTGEVGRSRCYCWNIQIQALPLLTKNNQWGGPTPLLQTWLHVFVIPVWSCLCGPYSLIFTFRLPGARAREAAPHAGASVFEAGTRV